MVPSPGARTFWAKTMRQLPFHGPGGPTLLSPRTGLFRCRGARPGARSARRILRKPVEASRKRASPTDAFCPEGPCPRATTEASRKCQSATGGPPVELGLYHIEISSIVVSSATHLKDQNKYSHHGTDDSQDFLPVHTGGKQRNGEKGKEQNIRVSYRFMVPGIGSQFDPFHI